MFNRWVKLNAEGIKRYGFEYCYIKDKEGGTATVYNVLKKEWDTKELTVLEKTRATHEVSISDIKYL